MASMGQQVGSAIDDRAPTVFGIVLIIVALAAAYGLVTGTLQAAWLALTGQSAGATTAGSAGSASVQNAAAAAIATPTPAPGATPSLGTIASFGSEYVAPNIAQPTISLSAVPQYPASSAISAAPSVSTPQNIYGPLAA